MIVVLGLVYGIGSSRVVRGAVVGSSPGKAIQASGCRGDHGDGLRLGQRFISRNTIVGADNYDMIEAYPDDKYFPSYLDEAMHCFMFYSGPMWKERTCESLLLTIPALRSGRMT